MSVTPENNIQVQKIPTIILTVSDADRLRDFYEQVLGFKCIEDVILEGKNYSNLEGIFEAKIRLLTLHLGDEKIKLMEYLNYQGQPIPQDSQTNDLWFQHLAIVVSNMDKAYAHVQSCSVDSVSTEPQTIPQSNEASAGVRAFKFKDPDGHNLELIWFPPDQGKKKWHNHKESLFLGIDHTAITVSNTEQSLKLYHELLGLEIKESSLNTGETQAHLDGLPEAKVQITRLETIQKGMGIELLDYQKPSNGRHKPENWTTGDLANFQIELLVNNVEKAVNKLHSNEGQFILSPLVSLEDNLTDYQQACLIQDPDKHALLLTAI